MSWEINSMPLSAFGVNGSARQNIASEMMTVIEVAEALRCSKAHIHNLIAGRVRGLHPLPAIHLGRRSLVRKESLRQWLESNESRVGMIRSSPDVDIAGA
jgi:excisionase family DNA binding protein